MPRLDIHKPASYRPHPYRTERPFDLEQEPDSRSPRPRRPSLLTQQFTQEETIAYGNIQTPVKSRLTREPLSTPPTPVSTPIRPSGTVAQVSSSSSPIPVDTDWLRLDTEDPYILISNDQLPFLFASGNSIWLKYIRKEDKRRLPGGVMIKCIYPKYVMLKNPYTDKRFSVQMDKVDFYAALSDTKTL